MIRPEDRAFQHVLWRESTEAPLIEYELNTKTYGVCSSPYLAMRTLRRLAADEGLNHQRAADILFTDIYIDDVLTGAESLQSAIDLKSELVKLLALGQFELRKWSSNDP